MRDVVGKKSEVGGARKSRGGEKRCKPVVTATGEKSHPDRSPLTQDVPDRFLEVPAVIFHQTRSLDVEGGSFTNISMGITKRKSALRGFGPVVFLAPLSRYGELAKIFPCDRYVTYDRDFWSERDRGRSASGRACDLGKCAETDEAPVRAFVARHVEDPVKEADGLLLPDGVPSRSVPPDISGDVEQLLVDAVDILGDDFKWRLKMVESYVTAYEILYGLPEKISKKSHPKSDEWGERYLSLTKKARELGYVDDDENDFPSLFFSAEYVFRSPTYFETKVAGGLPVNFFTDVFVPRGRDRESAERELREGGFVGEIHFYDVDEGPDPWSCVGGEDLVSEE